MLKMAQIADPSLMVARLDCCTGKLMMDVEEISDHFWRENPWGRAMKEQLAHPAQPK